MRTWRRSFALHAKGDEPVCCSSFLCFYELLAADEFRLFQIDEKTQAGFDRVVLWGKIRAVQRIAHLETQRVTRAQTAGANAKRFSLIEHFVPHHRGVLRGEENFHAVFAGI